MEDPRNARRDFARLEEVGYDGAFSFEAKHDPFLPLVAAAEHTRDLTLGTAIAIAFARNPMNLAKPCLRGAVAHRAGAFCWGWVRRCVPHIEKRFSMTWSRPAARMRELTLAIRAIFENLGGACTAAFRGRVLPPHPHDSRLRSRPQPVRAPSDLHRGFRSPDDAGRGRSGRRILRPPVQHAAFPAGEHPACPRRGARGPVGAAGKISTSSV